MNRKARAERYEEKGYWCYEAGKAATCMADREGKISDVLIKRCPLLKGRLITMEQMLVSQHGLDDVVLVWRTFTVCDHQMTLYPA